MKTRSSKMQQGFTLVEVMVALAVSTLVTIVILYSFSSLSTSLAATGHYRDMHHDVRHAMDIMQREITSSSGVSQCIASSRLSINTTRSGVSTGSVSVVYNLSSNVLSRTAGGSTNTLATGVAGVTFSLYDASGATTATPADAYFVGVEMEMQTRGVQNTYEDKLQIRSRMRGKGL